MNQDLYNFVQSELNAGKTPEQIAAALKVLGHTAEEMGEIIRHMDEVALQQQNAVQQNVMQQTTPAQESGAPQPDLNPIANPAPPSPPVNPKPAEKQSFFSKTVALYKWLNPKEETSTDQ